MAPARRHLMFAVVLVAACGSVSAAQPRTGPPDPAAQVSVPTQRATPKATPGPRLAPPEQAAIERLAALSGPIDPSTETSPAAVTLVSSLPADEQARFDEQITAAVDAAKAYATTDLAAAAGYVQSSTQLPGIGTHWVRWSLIDQPFDPAHPAMLLFDQSTLHPPRLAGFSYWVRSTPPPDGFTGPNDVWHHHSGLCFENGFLVGENVAAADQCAGQWLNGSDLWMLHAWVAPGVANAAGIFAARNNAMCPPYWQQIPDMLKCGGDTGGHDDGDVLAPEGSELYCHLPST